MTSPSRKELLGKIYKMVPPMLESFHKGQLGRVAVIGGSEDYTGAPYFSAMASARLGCDMSHVICEPGAGAVIKGYSPNLMVHPYMRQAKNMSSTESVDTVADQLTAMLARLHVLVIGPGLGRDDAMLDVCARVLGAARDRSMPVVLDADGLQLAIRRPELVDGYVECVMTPNKVEFARLEKSKRLDDDDDDEGDGGMAGDGSERCARLAKAFGGATIIQKGAKDYISNGKYTYVSDGQGGAKRSGGQGDTLTGTIATLLAWRKAYLDRIWDHQGDLDEKECLALAAFGGSAITRECSRLAFETKGRSMQAGDLTDSVHQAFLNLIGEKGSKL